MLRLKHLVKYLIGTKGHCWVFKYQDTPRVLEGYADSDWAEEPRTRKSVSSGLVVYGS